MRPGILALTSTSFASTVPISSRSDVCRVVARYQISEPTTRMPRIMKTLLRGFILPPKELRIESDNFRRRGVRQHSGGKLCAMRSIHKQRLTQELNRRPAPHGNRLG